MPKITSYLKHSYNKFRQDAFSKLFYDILKWVGRLVIIWAVTKLIPKNTDIGQLIIKIIPLSVYTIILSILLLIALTIICVTIIFNKKYRILQKDNYTDELTGLQNHKAFKKYLNGRLQTNRTFSIILIDVDDFKHFNTQYNQIIADKVLAKLGQLLGNDKRATDETFRQYLRGDEFIIIANETKLHDAKIAADRKKNLIAQTVFTVDGKSYNLTVSCGVTEVAKDDDFESIMSRVNEALKEAKRQSGKNYTCTMI